MKNEQEFFEVYVFLLLTVFIIFKFYELAFSLSLCF